MSWSLMYYPERSVMEGEKGKSQSNVNSMIRFFILKILQFYPSLD